MLVALTPEISQFNFINQDLLWDNLKASGIWSLVKLLQNSKNKKHRKAALLTVLAETEDQQRIVNQMEC